MKKLHICLSAAIAFTAHTNYSMKEKQHFIRDNYNIDRKEFFAAIKIYDAEECKKLLKNNKDLALTQCEIGLRNENDGETHYFPIWYLLSLEKNNDNEKENEKNDNKLKIARMIIQNTNDIEWLYSSLYYTLERSILPKNCCVTDVTIETFKEIFKQKNNITERACKSKDSSIIQECLKYDKKIKFNIGLFKIHFKAESDKEKEFVELLTDFEKK